MDAIDMQLVERLQQQHKDRTAEMWGRNGDIGQRLRYTKATAVIDTSADRFELTIGEPQEALSYSIRNTLYIRVDFDSLKIVGMELDNFSAHFAEKSPEYRLCWNSMLQSRIHEIKIRGDDSEDFSVSLGDIVKELETAG